MEATGRIAMIQRSSAALAAVLALAVSATAEIDDAAPSPRDLLARAFENRYEVDTTATIELVMRDRSNAERTRHFKTASKLIEDRMHAVGRLLKPEYLRGMAILQIEAEGRGHDAFVYMPSLRKVRRVSASQRGDAFFGTDVTYEDLERRRIEDYEVTGFSEASFKGESVWKINVDPLRPSTYDAAQFVIAQSDFTLLESSYFKSGKDEPYRIMTALRGDMVTDQGHTLPTRMRVENLRRGTTTEVTFRDLTINPKIDDRIFSVTTLEQERDLSKLID